MAGSSSLQRSCPLRLSYSQGGEVLSDGVTPGVGGDKKGGRICLSADTHLPVDIPLLQVQEWPTVRWVPLGCSTLLGETDGLSLGL